MAGFAARALRSLRDPWSVLVAGVGAGSAWAVGLPLGFAGVVGVGMLGVAAAVGGAVRADAPAAPIPEEPLRPGTVQARLVETLDGYRRELGDLRRRSLGPAVQAAADRAMSATDDAGSTARRVAAAVDQLDDAIGRAGAVAHQMPTSTEVRGTVDRMAQRRGELLGRLSSAADEVGEVYTKLLELSTSAGLLGVPTDAATGVAEVNDSLDGLRGVFTELDSEAVKARTLL